MGEARRKEEAGAMTPVQMAKMSAEVQAANELAAQVPAVWANGFSIAFVGKMVRLTFAEGIGGGGVSKARAAVLVEPGVVAGLARGMTQVAAMLLEGEEREKLFADLRQMVVPQELEPGALELGAAARVNGEEVLVRRELLPVAELTEPVN